VPAKATSEDNQDQDQEIQTDSRSRAILRLLLELCFTVFVSVSSTTKSTAAVCKPLLLICVDGLKSQNLIDDGVHDYNYCGSSYSCGNVR
jgi:hypothetical protein